MFRSLTIRTKVLAISCCISVLTMVALATMLTFSTASLITHELLVKKNSVLNVLSFDLNTNYGNQGMRRTLDDEGMVTDVFWNSIADLSNNKIVDLSAEQTFGIASVLEWDGASGSFKRLSSSPDRETGNRSVGSTLAAETATALRATAQGETIDAKADINGKKFLTRLTPIRSSSGEVIGALEAAIPASELSDVLMHKAMLAAGATLVLTLIALATISYSIPKFLRPIDEVGAAMSEIATGKYDADVPHQELTDSVGEIARKLGEFAEALSQAEASQDEKIREQEIAAKRAKEESDKQSRVVAELTDGLQRMASGDLSKDIESTASNPFPAEYENLRESYNDALRQLGGAMEDVLGAAANVRSGASEIDQAAGDLASRAETQAATLEQSAAALNELSESVRQSSNRRKRPKPLVAARANRRKVVHKSCVMPSTRCAKSKPQVKMSAGSLVSLTTLRSRPTCLH